MDPASAALVIGLISRTIDLGLETKNLIDKLRRGETVTQEDIDSAEALINQTVERVKNTR